MEIGASEYALRALLSNHDAVSIGIFSLPGANAIHISDQVRATMAKLKNDFPEGVKYSIAYDDPTVFVRDSINSQELECFDHLLRRNGKRISAG